ncbi:MAG: ABC transporter ATP-binding protein [Cyanobacteria bacterium]|nr:ABC transporter ATP-binding protein [Cyanobacteriota bacterium]
MSRIDCKNIWKIYNGNVIGVKDLTFTCNDKEFLAILGPSGGGKSSTLRMLAGLEEISKGEIQFDGKVVNQLGPAERNVALAFESYALYYRMNIYENIAFPLRAKGMKNKDVDKSVKEIAEALNLTSILKKKPAELAGGHQQRVSLARALVRKPNLTLLDEPLSHMDQRIRGEIRAQIRRIHELFGNTTIYVTHDQAEAISLCDRLLILNNAELQQIGTVNEIYNKPENKFVAYFVGQPGMNFINGKIESIDHIFLQTDDGKISFKFNGEINPKYIGSNITIGIRPQQIKTAQSKETNSIISGVVKIVEFQGDNDVITLQLNDINKTQIKVVIPAGGYRYKRGNICWLEFDPNFIHLFDEDEKSIVKR